MPLGVREVLLVVRAQNLGSGVLRNLAGDFNNLNGAAKRAAQQQMQTGSSLMAVGTGIAAIGAAGLLFLGKATAAAVNYNRQVALTQTQMYGVKASFEQVSAAGLEVARSVAVPLDQIQGGLYDIFSSMDVNLTQAKYLLTNFSKEAVAGQVDLSTAEKASIGILNAYQMKVTDVTKVQDTLFNLVKYGVGTYADFANAIGRVTGPAVRENQTFEQTAALMAFTTRNGLSAANAASSVGRALDALGKSRDKIQYLGNTVIDALGSKTANQLGYTADTMLKVTDASGKMLPVNQIMTELGTSLKNLNPTQLNDVLTTMFKGSGGTIQAMRFFDIAIHNYGQLNTMVKNMGNSKGALQAAYNIMSNTPAMKIQQLKNSFQALMIVLGQQFLPIVGNVAKVFSTLFGWLSKIPAPVLKIIAIIISVTSVCLVLTGIILILVGAWMVFNAVIAATELELAPIALTIGLVIAAVVALAVAAYLIYTHWGTISKFFHDLWFDIWGWIDHVLDNIKRDLMGAFSDVINFLSGTWSTITGGATKGWTAFYNAIMNVWKNITGFFSGISAWFAKNFDGWWKTHGEAVEKIWNDMWSTITTITKTWWDIQVAVAKKIFTTLEGLWNALVDVSTKTWDALVYLVTAVWDQIFGILKVAYSIISTDVKIFMDFLTFAFKAGWDIIVGIFRIAWDIISAAFMIWLNIIEAAAKIVWGAIAAYFKIIWDIIVGIFSVFLDVITGHWHTALQDIENIGIQVWNAIKGYLIVAWNAIKNAAGPIFNILRNTVVNIWHSIYDTTQQVWNNIKSFLSNVWAAIKSGLSGVVSGLGSIWSGVERVFAVPVNFVINTVYTGGIKKLWDGVMNAVGLSKFDLPAVGGIKLARGGRIPGFGGGDRVPILAEAGEAVVDKRRTRKYAGILGMMGVPGFAAGGLVGGPLGAIGGALKSIGNLGGAAGKLLAAAASGNQTAFANALTGAIPGGSGGAGGHLFDMIATLPVAMMKKAVTGIWGKLQTGISQAAISATVGAGKIGGGVKQWEGLVLQALAMEGLPAYLASQVLLQMMTESGGNPNAINLTDSNAAAGDPSRGLMQTIMSTFQAYHWPGTSNNIYDPLANIAAAINYARAAYGPTLMRGSMGMGSGHGYAKGGMVMPFQWLDNGGYLPPGLSMTYNGTGRPERVPGPQGRGGQPQQVFYITTQEIDPRRHAAQLGWELARRSA